MESTSSDTGSCPSIAESVAQVNYHTHHPHYYHHLGQRKCLSRQQSNNSFSGTSTSPLKNLPRKGELVASHSTPLLNCDQVTKVNSNSDGISKLGRRNTTTTNTSHSNEDRRKRTILIERKNNSFGFTLQTYGIHHKKEGEVELLSYVDFVDVNGPAFKAGLREGDVILSINGQNMEKADHQTLVKFIKSCDRTMRMVVLFEDCVRKVNLHMKFLQLRKELAVKLSEYERLCKREAQILSGQKSNSNTDSDLITSPTYV